MPLPIAPAPRSDDVAVLDWAGITVRVAWALTAANVRIRPAVLRAAREHAIHHIDPHWTSAQAEDRAATATESFIVRARHRLHATAWPSDDAMPPSPRWRRAFDRTLDPLSRLVFRKHFGDGRPLDKLEARAQVDRISLEAARGGLREILRKVAGQDGISMDAWSVERIDRMLGRLAAFASGPCPPANEVVDGFQAGHLEGCPRCDKLARLVTHGRLTLDDLVPPTLGARPRKEVGVIALQLQAVARQHRDELARRLDGHPMGDDLIFVDVASRATAARTLVACAELGAPSRDQMRGVVATGVGSWTRHGLLGPLLDRAESEARQRPWGLIDGLGELPAVLPAPAPASRWWSLAAAFASVAWLAGRGAWLPEPIERMWPMDVAHAADASGAWLDIAVDDRARLALITFAPQAQIAWAGDRPQDKAAVATGDGRYAVHTPIGGAVVASLDSKANWTRLLAELPTDDAPAALARRIRLADPRADVFVVPAQP